MDRQNQPSGGFGRKDNRPLTNKREIMRINNENGFTLTELMVTVAIFAIVLTAVYASFDSQFKSWQTQEDVATVQADIRSAAEMLTRDVRNAGFGVPTGVTSIVAASANSISLSLAEGIASTFITSTAFAQNGSQFTVSVDSSSGFVTGQNYNVIFADAGTKTVTMGTGAVTDKITAIPSATSLTLTGTLPANGFNVGDLIVSPGVIPPPPGANRVVTYSLSSSASGTTLKRADPVTGTMDLINNVQSIAFEYTTDGNTWTQTPPANLANIVAVKFAINGQTGNQISSLNGQKRTRTVNAIVALRN
jgi:prepilin-type N-terminal cleavage/methylation domain-containing protein